MTGKNHKKLKKTVSALCWVLIVLMVGFVAFLSVCNASGKVAFIGNRAMIKILTSSMEKTIPTGGYILVERIDTSNIGTLEVGDVIVFTSRDPQISGKLNTHRINEIIVGENGTQYATKGDNNTSVDALLTAPEDVVGRYIKNLDGVTKLSGIFGNRAIYFFLILIPAAVLLFICLLDVVKKSKEIKMDALVAAQVEKLKTENAKKNSEINADSGINNMKTVGEDSGEGKKNGEDIG